MNAFVQPTAVQRAMEPPHPYQGSTLTQPTVYTDEEIAEFKRKGWEIVKGTRIDNGMVKIVNRDGTHEMTSPLSMSLAAVMRNEPVVHFWAVWEDSFYHCFELAQQQDW